MNSNVIQMPTQKPRTNWRRWARNILFPPAPKAAFTGLTQAEIDGRAADWHEQSESNNARLARILARDEREARELRR